MYCQQTYSTLLVQVRCVYTRQWKYRQEGLDVIKRELMSDTPELISERDARSVIAAVVHLLKKGINEQVHPVRISMPEELLLGKMT